MTNTIKKKCATCKKSKLLSEFAIDNQRKNGRSSYCGLCKKDRSQKYYQENKHKMKDSYLRKLYNISMEEYLNLLEKQGGVCAICRTVGTAKRAMHVDHDHETGAVRAILCHGCNSGLGAFKDSPHLLRLAAEYVEEFNDC